jgi:hypothetical protein
MQHTIPYEPQQNGVVERNNCTLKETNKIMIQSKGLSPNYWAKAINCANYIDTNSLTKDLKNITLEESQSEIKLDVSHLYVFGSEAWAHIPYEKRKSLQPKSEKFIFVRYFEYLKGYKPVQTHSNKIIINRYVKFY